MCTARASDQHNNRFCVWYLLRVAHGVRHTLWPSNQYGECASLCVLSGGVFAHALCHMQIRHAACHDDMRPIYLCNTVVRAVGINDEMHVACQNNAGAGGHACPVHALAYIAQPRAQLQRCVCASTSLVCMRALPPYARILRSRHMHK